MFHNKVWVRLTRNIIGPYNDRSPTYRLSNTTVNIQFSLGLAPINVLCDVCTVKPFVVVPHMDVPMAIAVDNPLYLLKTPWAPSQYPKRRLSVRSRKVSSPRDLYLELSDRSESWQAPRQQCCRCACQISKRYDNLKYQSRGFETLRYLTKRRLFRYWDGALGLLP